MYVFVNGAHAERRGQKAERETIMRRWHSLLAAAERYLRSALERWIYEKFKSLFIVRECERTMQVLVWCVWQGRGWFVCCIFTAGVALFQLC